MNPPKLKKLFGCGPLGAALSLGLFGLFAWADKWAGHLPIGPGRLMQPIGVVLICAGCMIHVWSFITLRRWWINDQLCTSGPFKFFRHPMYAAWISFVCPGIACYLNSWVYILWIAALQWLWRRLAKKEELCMLEIFGMQYREYAAKTGRFWPKLRAYP
jgi:protein-S-isoprenylcysteine O-methyltransferase Ste14